MIDHYIIDAIKREEEDRLRREREAQIPLYIYPPDTDERRIPKKNDNTNKKGYIEIDFEVDLDINKDDSIIEI